MSQQGNQDGANGAQDSPQSTGWQLPLMQTGPAGAAQLFSASFWNGLINAVNAILKLEVKLLPPPNAGQPAATGGTPTQPAQVLVSKEKVLITIPQAQQSSSQSSGIYRAIIISNSDANPYFIAKIVSTGETVNVLKPPELLDAQPTAGNPPTSQNIAATSANGFFTLPPYVAGDSVTIAAVIGIDTSYTDPNLIPINYQDLNVGARRIDVNYHELTDCVNGVQMFRLVRCSQSYTPQLTNPQAQ